MTPEECNALLQQATGGRSFPEAPVASDPDVELSLLVHGSTFKVSRWAAKVHPGGVLELDYTEDGSHWTLFTDLRQPVLGQVAPSAGSSVQTISRAADESNARSDIGAPEGGELCYECGGYGYLSPDDEDPLAVPENCARCGGNGVI